ncbi:unnamed protein product [Citrullus colocynthis]|uniref:Uncharacterized protein n=1 Tax=Citrullus colocynthis TaxID=252529 RepID=A0ABP0YQ52_9ROSI
MSAPFNQFHTSPFFQPIIQSNSAALLNWMQQLGSSERLASKKMGLHDWEFIDCHGHDEKTHRSGDQNRVVSLNHTDQSIVSVSKVSGLTLIGDVKKESGTAAEFEVEEEENVNSRRIDLANLAMEKRKQWGRMAICSFGIAVAATICSLLLGSHSHHRGGASLVNKRNC